MHKLEGAMYVPPWPRQRLFVILAAFAGISAVQEDDNYLRVLFLGENVSGPGDGSAEAFDFWVAQVNDNFGKESGIKVDGLYYRVEGIREQYAGGADARSVVQGWVDQSVAVVILGLPLDMVRDYSVALEESSLQHVAVDAQDSTLFQDLNHNTLWGVQSDEADLANGWVDLLASQSGNDATCCLLHRLSAFGPNATTSSSTRAVVKQVRERAAELGLNMALDIEFNDTNDEDVVWDVAYNDTGDDEGGTPALMRRLAQQVVGAGCDLLFAYVGDTKAAVSLQWFLANLSAPLRSEFFLPEPEASAWGALGSKGNLIFTGAQWHPSANYAGCQVFKDTTAFVSKYREWYRDTFQIDRGPTQQEATVVAAGTLIQLALLNEDWFPQVEEYINDLNERLTAYADLPGLAVRLARSADRQAKFGLPSVPIDVGEVVDAVEDVVEELENILPRSISFFSYRFGMALRAMDTISFYGRIRFDASGMNTGKRPLTLQFFNNSVASAVRPIAVSATKPVIPADSFEARAGCPPGTAKRARSDTSTLIVSGSACVSCSELYYQDEYDQVECKPCLLGEISGRGATRCTPCDPGEYRGELDTECVQCNYGEFTNQSGATACTRCSAGRFASDFGQSHCEICPPGWIAGEGMQTCQPCGPGFSTEGLNESARCFACPLHSYADAVGSADCISCNATFETASIASNSSATCVCPPGSYWHRETPESEPRCESQHCDVALMCDGYNNEPPKTALLFSAGPQAFEGAEPSYIVKCANSVDCPIGLALGSCPESREPGLACAQCEEDYTKVDGRCVSCESTPLYIPTLVILAFALGFVALVIYALHFHQAGVQAEGVVHVTAVAGILLTAGQIMAVLRFIEIDWPEPFQTFHQWYGALMEPVELLNLHCTWRVSDPLHTYVTIVVLWPWFIAVLALVLKAARYLPRPVGADISNTQVFQIVCILLTMFYTSVSMLALVPWQCEANPDGTESVVAYRQVLCWESGKHAGMVVTSVFAVLIFICGFTCLVMWATYQYPRRITRPSGIRFLRRFRWVFSRFAPDKYYCGLIYCTRNLLVAMLPVIFVEYTALQLFMIVSILLCSFGFVCWVQPWKTEVGNRFDAVVSFMLVLILFSGSLLLTNDQEKERLDVRKVVMIFFSITIAILCLVLLVLFARAVRVRLNPHKQFGFFLCHHKVGAAILARWVKIELKLRLREEVFLDSDMLSRLDTLFEFVTYQTQNFVVLLTKETLRRIWCAGEITTALRHGLNIICIACNDYEEPSDDFIRDLDHVWTDAQLTEVARQGVTLQQIREAFEQFREIPKLHLDRTAPLKEQERLIELLLKRSTGIGIVRPRGTLSAWMPPQVRSWWEQRQKQEEQQQPQAGDVEQLPPPAVSTPAEADTTKTSSRKVSNMLVGNLADPESSMVCRVIQVQLQQVLQSGIQIANNNLQQAVQQLHREPPAHLVVVLTRGVMARLDFAVALVTATSLQRSPALIPIVADYFFVFPDTHFWESLEQGHVISGADLASYGISLSDVALAYKALLTIITKRYSSHGSENIQMAEINDIAGLFNGFTGSFTAGSKRSLSKDKG